MIEARQIATWQAASDRAGGETNPARERNRRACQSRRDQLRAAGLCIFDGHRPAAHPSPLCDVCRERQSGQARERYRAAQAAANFTPRPYRRRKAQIGGGL